MAGGSLALSHRLGEDSDPERDSWDNYLSAFWNCPSSVAKEGKARSRVILLMTLSKIIPFPYHARLSHVCYPVSQSLF